jgi:hypothetical protein
MRITRVAAMVLIAATLAPAAELTKDQWRENLAVLAKELPARHVNLFFQLPRAEWEKRVALLDRAIANLSDYQIRIEMTKLVAAVGDSHTRINGVLGDDGRYLYLGYREFADGLSIIDTIVPYQEAIGARVVSVDGMPVDEVRRRLDALVGAENAVARGSMRVRFLSDAALLKELGVLQSAEQAEFVFERDGRRFAMAVKTLPAERRLAEAEKPVHVARPDPRPLWLKRREEAYWSEWLSESRTLFVQYNSCRNDEKLPFAKFTEQVVAQARRGAPERLVIDLRHNGGGDSEVSNSLLTAISREKALRPSGGTYVLIGASTYSSGELVALRLKRNHKAVLVGEPTGQKPNSYGDIRPFSLPHGGITVWYSTKWFPMMRGSDPTSLMPDRAVLMTAADYVAGRDPVLESVIRKAGN